MIYIIATVTAAAGKSDEFIALAGPLLESTRAEEGNISYDLHQSISDPHTLVFVERWASKEAIDAHMKADHYLAFQKSAGGLVAGLKVDKLEDTKTAKE